MIKLRTYAVGGLLLVGGWFYAAPVGAMLQDPPFDWELTLLATAGSLDGPGALADAFHVELGPNGEILVAQATAQEIAVFDADGRFDRIVGGSGRGPGEFSLLGRIGWVGDTLWTLDIPASRVHLWDSSFELVRTVTPTLPPPSAGLYRNLVGPWMGGGELLGVPMAFEDHPALPILLVSEEGREEQTLAMISTEGRSAQMELEGRVVPFPNPWSSHPLWDASPDGESIVVVERPIATEESEGEFRVVRIHVSGDTVLDRSVPYVPVPLTQEEAEDIIAEMARGVPPSLGLAAPEAERRIRAALDVPSFYPPVRDLVLGRDGSVWLKREDASSGHATWQVLTAAGEEWAWVEVPEALEMHGADGDSLWGVVTDEMDVPSVHVYAIER